MSSTERRIARGRAESVQHDRHQRRRTATAAACRCRAPSRSIIAVHFLRAFDERKPAAIQIFKHDLANAMSSRVRRRLVHRAATLHVRVETIHVVHVEVDVARERTSLPLSEVSAPNLEEDPDAGALHNRADSAGFVLRRLEHAASWIEAEAEYAAIVLLPTLVRSEPRERAMLAMSCCSMCAHTPAAPVRPTSR